MTRPDPALFPTKRAERAKTALCLALLALAALLVTLPFAGGTLPHGSDLGYHARRIENIAIGLANRQFPVRIQSDWVGGAGYATGVFYGDLFLYFPAVLRLLGVPITAAYGAYLALCNLLTAWGFYGCTRRLGAGRTAAVCGGVLYTLSAYRICDLTDRAALGEFTALAFLPLVACGFWLTVQKARGGRTLLVVGLSGVLQSHLLSFEMTVLLLAMAALPFLRRSFVRFAQAAGVFCLLNAGYLVPLFDYYFTGKFQINQPAGTEPIQQNGAILGQLLGLPYTVAAGQQQDLVQNMALTPGPALLVGALAAAVVLASARKPALWLAVGGAAALWMSGNFFPWDALYQAAPRVVGSLQFPWRFLGPATLLLALAVTAGVDTVRRHQKGRAAACCAAAVLCAVSFCCARNQQNDYLARAQRYDWVCGTEEPYWEQGCGHYLPAGNGPTVLSQLPAGPVWSDGVTLENYAKTGTTVTLDVTSGTDGGWVRLPLLWYKGYRVTQGAGTVACGPNNVVLLELLPSWAGTVTVAFAEPWYWRLAELVSLAALAGGAALLHRRRKTRP